MRPQRLTDACSESSSPNNSGRCGDPVGDVDDTDRAERRARQQLMQPERQDVRVGRRKLVAQREAGHVRVGASASRSARTVRSNAAGISSLRPGRTARSVVNMPRPSSDCRRRGRRCDRLPTTPATRLSRPRRPAGRPGAASPAAAPPRDAHRNCRGHRGLDEPWCEPCCIVVPRRELEPVDEIEGARPSRSQSPPELCCR